MRIHAYDVKGNESVFGDDEWIWGWTNECERKRTRVPALGGGESGGHIHRWLKGAPPPRARASSPLPFPRTCIDNVEISRAPPLHVCTVHSTTSPPTRADDLRGGGQGFGVENGTRERLGTILFGILVSCGHTLKASLFSTSSPTTFAASSSPPAMVVAHRALAAAGKHVPHTPYATTHLTPLAMKNGVNAAGSIIEGPPRTCCGSPQQPTRVWPPLPLFPLGTYARAPISREATRTPCVHSL